MLHTDFNSHYTMVFILRHFDCSLITFDLASHPCCNLCGDTIFSSLGFREGSSLTEWYICLLFLTVFFKILGNYKTALVRPCIQNISDLGNRLSDFYQTHTTYAPMVCGYENWNLKISIFKKVRAKKLKIWGILVQNTSDLGNHALIWFSLN